MPSEKVGASQHNVRAASKNTLSPGSKPSEPPSLIGGGGSIYLEEISSSKVDLTPPPIKRRDYCRDLSCGDPWTFHFDKKALQQHIRSWFADPNGLPYGKWASIVNVLGIETVNEIIQVYRVKHEQIELAGDKVRNRATFFKYCRDYVEQGMEARDNPANAEAAWAALRKNPIKTAKDKAHDAYEADYVRRFGPRKGK
jgi:hypothetical protein|tara:strand:- start:229 stop:822 length:594 start_codon:yes stop_codon:yes gene_type:complete